jgi:hypothetical protein
MSSAASLSIHPSLYLIFPVEGLSRTDKKSDLKELDPNTAWHFYSHSVRRNPKDLTLHTRRVFFAMQHKDSSFLAGSLHDLFYVLKDAGENLRIRLLKASLPYLSKKDTLYLAMWIKRGIKNGMGYRWVPGSVLTDGLFGADQNLITVHKVDQDQVELTPLEEARSCMEYGQLDVAQKILEEALKANANDEKLHEELAYLKQYTKSREIQPRKETQTSFLGKLKEKVFS